jgi:hypothetical protein
MASWTDTGSSLTSYPLERASSMMEARVTPGRMVPARGGVVMVLPLTTKMLQEDTSSR